jgi:hypothetical protein
MRFRATIELFTKTGTGIEVPVEIVSGVVTWDTLGN